MAKFITFTDTYSGNEASVEPSAVGAVLETQDGAELWGSGLRLTVDQSVAEVLKAPAAAQPPLA